MTPDLIPPQSRRASRRYAACEKPTQSLGLAPTALGFGWRAAGAAQSPRGRYRVGWTVCRPSSPRSSTARVIVRKLTLPESTSRNA
jgi:hypothetical protein